jgi:hypothetical protein
MDEVSDATVLDWFSMFWADLMFDCALDSLYYLMCVPKVLRLAFAQSDQLYLPCSSSFPPTQDVQKIIDAPHAEPSAEHPKSTDFRPQIAGAFILCPAVAGRCSQSIVTVAFTDACLFQSRPTRGRTS